MGAIHLSTPCKESFLEIPDRFEEQKTPVVIIRLSYTHRFYENALSKTVLDTYTV